MKQAIVESLAAGMRRLQAAGALPSSAALPTPRVDRPRAAAGGDYASNAAFLLAPLLGTEPREAAERLCRVLELPPEIQRVEVAGAGFLNFFSSEAAEFAVLRELLEAGPDYGRAPRNGRRALVEFVSANPTGPLHVGHGRGAAYGASLAAMLEAAGYEVHCEYYVNDAGRQADLLGLSGWLRYLQQGGQALAFPDGAYRGDYLGAHAEALAREWGDALRVPADALPVRGDGGAATGAVRAVAGDGAASAGGTAAAAAATPASAAAGTGVADAGAAAASAAPAGDAAGADAAQETTDSHLDRLIAATRAALGDERFDAVRDFLLERVRGGIQAELEACGIRYHRWFSERELLATGAVERAVASLREAGAVEERGGALWFLASRHGDDKDRVLRRGDGRFTYYAADIAYHLDKFGRGFDLAVNVWGVDHHGYVARLRAALEVLGIERARLDIRLVQFIALRRDGKRARMSTRSGTFDTLEQLRNEVGSDAARFFYVMRRADQEATFDLALARATSRDNPVYYIQYAHARVCSLDRELAQRGLSCERQRGLDAVALLTEEDEKALAQLLAEYPERVARSAAQAQPHELAAYLRELAGMFHTYYHRCQLLVNDASLRDARLCLAYAVRQVLANGCALLGVSAPEKM